MWGIAVLLIGGALRVEAPPCAIEWIDLDRVEALLRLELESSAAASLAAAEAPDERARARAERGVDGAAVAAVTATATIAILAESCDAVEARLSIEIAGERFVVPLAAVETRSRPRTAALAIYERLRAVRERVAGADSSSAEALGAGAEELAVDADSADAAESGGRAATRSAPPATSAATGEVPAFASLFVDGSARAIFDYGRPYFGARVGASLPFRRLLLFDLRADAAIQAVRAHHSLGTVDLRLVTAAVALLAEWRGDGLIFGAGPKLELGVVNVQASSTMATTIARSDNDFVLAAALHVLFALRIVGAWWAEIGVDFGHVLDGYQAIAGDDAVAGVSGFYAAWFFGAALAL